MVFNKNKVRGFKYLKVSKESSEILDDYFVKVLYILIISIYIVFWRHGFLDYLNIFFFSFFSKKRLEVLKYILLIFFMSIWVIFLANSH